MDSGGCATYYWIENQSSESVDNKDEASSAPIKDIKENLILPDKCGGFE